MQEFHVPENAVHPVVEEGDKPADQQDREVGMGPLHLEGKKPNVGFLIRISEIRRLQDQGLTLSEIARDMDGSTEAMAKPATSWWWYQLQPDVVVQVRADAAPWRLRHIQKALKEFNERLGSSPNPEPQTNWKSKKITTEDVLLELAARMESDGGMPGGSTGDRILMTIVALLCFRLEGHGIASGAFRVYVEKLTKYLKQSSRNEPSVTEKQAIEKLLADSEQEKPLQGQWFSYARDYLNASLAESVG